MFGWRCLIVLLLFFFERVLTTNAPFYYRNQFSTIKAGECNWKFNETGTINGYVFALCRDISFNFQWPKHRPLTIFYGFSFHNDNKPNSNFLRIGDCFVEFKVQSEEYNPRSFYLFTEGVDERPIHDILSQFDQKMVNKFTLWPGQPSDEECPTEKYYSETPDGNVWTRIAFATDSTVKNFQAMIVSDGPVSEYPSYGYYSTPAPTTAHTTTSSTTSSTDSTSTSESNTTVEWTQNTNESSWANETTEIPTTQFPACEDLAKSFSTSISPMIVLFILEIFIHLMLRV